jgi:hypothetical protein
MLKFDKFLARKGNIDQDIGQLRFLLLDYGPFISKAMPALPFHMVS